MRARAASAASFALLGVSFGAWTARLAEIKASLDLAPAVLGVTFAAWSAAALLAVPIAGGIVERIGSRRVFLLGGAVHLVALAMLGFAPSALALAAVLALYGASGGFVDMAINAHGAYVERAYARPIFSGLHALFSVGVLVGAGASAAAIWSGLGVRAYLVGVAVVLAFVGLPVARAFLEEEDRHERPPIFALPTRALAVPAGLAFVALFAEDIANAWTAVYTRETAGAGGSSAALAVAAFAAGMVVARLVADALVARLGRRAVVACSAAVCASGFALASALPHPAGAATGFALVGAGVGPIFPLALAAAARRGLRGSAPAMAAASTVGSIGSLAGPSAVGVIGDVAGLRVALLVVAVVVAAGIVLGARLR